MNSLSDMAALYDEWATAHEATAKDILACLDSFAVGIRENQRWRADWLTADAAELRARAAQLREVNRRVRCTTGPTNVSMSTRRRTSRPGELVMPAMRPVTTISSYT
jgi:hypothetical protein